MTEPFGRQPLPVVITIVGQDERDSREWLNFLLSRAGYKGDNVQCLCMDGLVQSFKIFPRANND